LANRSQLDLIISSLVLIRKASSAIDAALNMPAADRAELEGNLDAVRGDLNGVVKQLGGSIPGAAVLGRRPEVKAAAGIVDFLARQGAVQLGAVAGLADTVRQGGDSRGMAQKIERHLAAEGVASRDDLAVALGVEVESTRFQEALERALGSGMAEWYGPGLYGVPRNQLEELASDESEVELEDDAAEAEAGDSGGLHTAVASLEGSLSALGSALSQTASEEPAGPEQIRELRRLADDGVISETEFDLKKREILERM
jgi:hypothetical protein